MKKVIAIIMIVLIVAALTACSQKTDSRTSSGAKTVNDVLNQQSETQAAATINRTQAANPVNEEENNTDDRTEIDLTEMNSTMVYSEVQQMMQSPGKYRGKQVRMKGSAASAEYNGKTYHACLIKDATACCSQGIEYVLTEGDYPADGTEITVYGTFDCYEEEGKIYNNLVGAKLES